MVLGALVAACFLPLKFSGYRPSGPGSLVESYCVAGVRDRLRLDAPRGAAIFLRASDGGREAAVNLDVYLEVPAGVSLRLLSPDVHVQSPEWSEPRLLAIGEITAPGPRHYAVGDVLPGSSTESLGRFSLRFRPNDMPHVNRFALSLPAMSINDEPFQAATVMFEAYREWGTYTCVQ